MMPIQFRVLIPAAGRGSRSGLSYPKSLYRIDGVPILIRICRTFAAYDSRPVLVINSAQQPLFEEVFAEFGMQAAFVYQDDPKGMGDAILQSDAIIAPGTHILLVWSDIPLLSADTVRHLVHCHTACANDFSLITSVGDNCYTIVDREGGRLKSIKETRALGIPPAKYGERDIGLFAFRKDAVFPLLAEDLGKSYENGKNEHGFLYVVEKLAERGNKIEGYPVALPNDILSFNTPEDLKMIEDSLR